MMTSCAKKILSSDDTLFSLLLKGGWVMIPLAVLSILAVYCCLDRFFALWPPRVSLSIKWLESINRKLLEADYKSVYNICAAKQSAMSNIIKAGLDRFLRDGADFEVAIENCAQSEVKKMEKNLNLLATIASIAPMLGFFGTVIGMIQAFMSIAQESSVSPQTISYGIYEALITTAAGLFIAIVSTFGYNLASSRVATLVATIEDHSNKLIELLTEIKKMAGKTNDKK